MLYYKSYKDNNQKQIGGYMPSHYGHKKKMKKKKKKKMKKGK